MKKLILLFVVIAAFKNSFSQAPDWIWADGTGLSGFQYGSTLYSSQSGDIFAAGRLTSGTSVMGGVSVNSAGTAAFVGRIHPSGSFDWVNVYPVGSFDYLFAFYRAPSGTIYGTGTAQGSGSESFWAQRWDSTGVQNWIVTNNDGPQGTAIAADPWGNIYVGGGYNGSATFSGITISSSGGQNIFLLKYNSAGNLVWAKNIGSGGDNESIKGLATDNNGNIYFTGGYTGSPSFVTKSLPASSGYEDFYVTEFDSTGNPVWVNTVANAGPASNYDNGADLKLDECGNVYVTSCFEGTTQFGSLSLTSQGGHDIFVGKLLSNGNWEWVQSAGGSSDREEGTGISLDKDFDVYISGIFQNTAYFGSTAVTNPNSGKDGMFVAKYDNAGDFQWVQTSVASAGDENGAGITVDNNKFVYATGDFIGTAIFGSSSVVAGSNWPNNDLYIAKLDTLPNMHIAVSAAPSYCPGSSSQLSFNSIGTFNSGKHIYCTTIRFLRQFYFSNRNRNSK